MTIVGSRLVGPDGKPVAGHPVYATLVAPASWLADRHGRVVNLAETVTDSAGWWSLELTPGSALEWAGHARYRIIEGPGGVHLVDVPDSPTPVWLRDILTDEQLTITWTPDPVDLLRVHVTVTGFGTSGARLDFGDGTPPIVVTTLEAIGHTYTTPGRHEVTATDVANPTMTGAVAVTVAEQLPRAHAFVDSDDPWTVLLWIDEPDDDTRYLVDFDDGSPAEEHGGHLRVPPHPRAPHRYTRAGRYDITVTNLATRRSTRVEYVAGQIGLLFTYDIPKRPRLEALWLANGATWEVENPDDAQVATGIVPQSGRVTLARSTDMPIGDHPVEVREVINGQIRRSAVRRVVQPTQWDWRLGVELTWHDPTDPPGRHTVTVTPKSARSPCIVEWGDDTPNDTVQPGQTVSHLYTLPAPLVGWRLRVTETEIEDPRTWTRALGEPRHVGTPVLSSRTGNAVDLDIEGIGQDYNDDWYSITWEQGGHTDPVGAAGRFYPAHTVYAAPGHKVITVDGPGMREPITRTVDVVGYPSPTLTVDEAVDEDGKIVDPNRMTVRINVDNTASGGLCTVRAGDDSTPRLSTEVDSFLHAYPAPGTYYVIASSNTDPTARARYPVTVPFGQARTLLYTVTGVPGDDPAADIHTVQVTITGKTPGKTILVRWETGGQTQPVPPSDEITHQYPPVQEFYTITVSYENGSESWGTDIEIPWPGDQT